MKLKLKLLLLVLLASVLMPLAIPNDFLKNGSPLIGLFCLVPLFYALTRAPSFGFASLLGMIYGALSNALMYYWLAFFGEYSVWTLGGPIFGYILFNALLAPFLYGFAKAFPGYRAFVLPMVWVVYELLKSIGFLGFPWGIMAHPFHMFLPFIQIADITGIWGISLLITFVNGWITEAFLIWPVISLKKIQKEGLLKGVNNKWLLQGAFIFSLILLALLYGAVRLSIKIPTEKNFSVILVQHNRDPWRNNAMIQSIIEGIELSEQGLNEAAETPDLVVWSETNFQYPIFDQPERFEGLPSEKPFLPFVRESGTYFLVGAPKVLSWDPIKAMNSTILIDSDGVPLNYYGKQHPVPMVESIPLWNFSPVRKFYQEVIGISSPWTVGEEGTIFELPLRDGNTLTFSTPICFEDAFADLNRKFIRDGADVLINLTNVSWSQRESAEIQMFVAAKFRAVENKRLLFRSTNSGVTSIIDPFGRTIGSLPLFKAGYLYKTVAVPREKKLTLYTLWGDWFPRTLFVFLVVILFFRHLLSKIDIDKLRRKLWPFYGKRSGQ